ncbi:DUF4145 domain-containing protein [Raoultella ornithinolytica]|nr:DUF4145 domain-containing protein [Raoultella ornithinolytica]EKX4893890.1 DUF4145 domain-containing protein [Raoultella ornithinolytica]
MDRKKLTSSFSLSEQIPWACPTCHKGVLKILEGSFQRMETARSHAIHAYHRQYVPQHVEYVYSCLFQCSNRTCNDVVSSSGVGFVDFVNYELDDDGYYSSIYGDYFRPRNFEPALNLISIPDNCPNTILEPLRESFKLFFNSLGASANNARIAIEVLLTELGVPDKRHDGGFIKLHKRIESIPPAYAHVKDMLEAVKWIGNAGSHHSGAKPDIEDVLDTYELIEHVLEEIYAPRLGRLIAIAEKINKNKGP